MEPSPLVQLTGLGKRFGDFTAVEQVDLRIDPGEIVALLGPNGAGKTTTIRMLMGHLRPGTGTATIAGHDCFSGRAEAMRVTGYVADEPVFHDYLTAREILRFVGGLHGIAAGDLAERAMAWATRLGFADAIDDYAANYSRGMKKKLALACALLPRPRLLILDEPANGLDPYAARELLAVVSEQAGQGVAVLFSTHLIDQAERVAGRAAIMARGRLVADGPVSDLRQRLAAGGTLEDVFFALTAGAEPT